MMNLCFLNKDLFPVFVCRTVDDERKRKELRDATVSILDSQVRAVNQRREDEAAARRQEIQGMKGYGG